ncbi:MAG: hypothetical protein IKV67_02025, partial [Paludibacteraceae bacterium]|nr:hypothetical protein [Paludibacteraceae bacterium]
GQSTDGFFLVINDTLFTEPLMSFRTKWTVTVYVLTSFVAGPQGELLYEGPTDKEDCVIVDIDMERSENVRRIWPFLRDRRIEEFGDLCRRFRD